MPESKWNLIGVGGVRREFFGVEWWSPLTGTVRPILAEAGDDDKEDDEEEEKDDKDDDDEDDFEALDPGTLEPIETVDDFDEDDFDDDFDDDFEEEWEDGLDDDEVSESDLVESDDEPDDLDDE
jgi:hypothetical protein